MGEPDECASPWQNAPLRSRSSGLMFGAMYEDVEIEVGQFAPHSRVFCICSAGCTALALSAAGHEVTAVDVNPQQIRYARARSNGAPTEDGAVEHLLLAGRRALFPVIGWRAAYLRQFLEMDDASAQVEYWRSRFDTQRWRVAVNMFLSEVALSAVYRRPFVGAVPPRFGSILRVRLERGWRTHSNRSNPYAWRLLLGRERPNHQPPGAMVRFLCEDAASHLEKCPRGSFDGFSLSNITDSAPPHYVRRLLRAVQSAATSHAIVVMRSFTEPRTESSINIAANDRSMIWGVVNILRVQDLCSTF